MSSRAKFRAERRQELQKLWNAPVGRQHIFDLFYSIYPDGVRLPDDVSMIDIILVHEYGSNEDQFLRGDQKWYSPRQPSPKELRL